ncbi:hypothetical protein, partial [Microcoleus sp. herbarium5]|uniref:hypothetical protein n=1 Tax=Microcoleus sp. herbarium5 TaxID=3055434 RepID=UPI002FD431BC
MSETTQSNTKAATDGCGVPPSIMTASQDELDNVELEIKGNLCLWTSQPRCHRDDVSFRLFRD